MVNKLQANQTMKAWSYSRLKAFETCHLQFYHMKVLRTYEEPETEAMHYGNVFHEAAEEYIRDGTPLPKGFLFAKDALDALNKFKGDKLCEYKMGLKPDLTACAFDDELQSSRSLICCSWFFITA